MKLEKKKVIYNLHTTDDIPLYHSCISKSVVLTLRIFSYLTLIDRDLPDPGIKPASPALQGQSLPLSHLGSLFLYLSMLYDLNVGWGPLSLNPLSLVLVWFGLKGCTHGCVCRGRGLSHTQPHMQSWHWGNPRLWSVWQKHTAEKQQWTAHIQEQLGVQPGRT